MRVLNITLMILFLASCKSNNMMKYSETRKIIFNVSKQKNKYRVEGEFYLNKQQIQDMDKDETGVQLSCPVVLVKANEWSTVKMFKECDEIKSSVRIKVGDEEISVNNSSGLVVRLKVSESKSEKNFVHLSGVISINAYDKSKSQIDFIPFSSKVELEKDETIFSSTKVVNY